MDGDWLPPETPDEPPRSAPAGPPLPPRPQPPPPPPGYPPQPPAGYPPQPPQPPGYQPPSPPGHPPPVFYPHPYPVYPPQPPNNNAVAGFTCALTGVGLLFFTMGFSSIVSLILGIVAIPYSRRGRRAVDEGKTTKHRDLAKAGYVIGIVTVVLATLATVGWTLIIALTDWDEDDDYDYDDPDEFQFQVLVRVAAGAARLIG